MIFDTRSFPKCVGRVMAFSVYRVGRDEHPPRRVVVQTTPSNVMVHWQTIPKNIQVYRKTTTPFVQMIWYNTTHEAENI